nr:MAG TPA: hypothetical protein [Caudoviricetes sp.]
MAIVITDEMLRKADDYLSLSQKEGLAHYLAMACVDEVNDPPILVERSGVKQQTLMGVLAKLYLGQSFETQRITNDTGIDFNGVLDCIMSRDAYDEWAGSHAFAQLSRYAKYGQPEQREKAYAILHDHKLFTIMLQQAIDDRIKQANDPLKRVIRLFQQSITPEKMEELTKQLTELKAQVESAGNE